MNWKLVPLAVTLIAAQTTSAAPVFQIVNRAGAVATTDPTFGHLITAMNTLADTLQTTVNDGFLSDANRLSMVTPLAGAGAAAGSSGLMADYGSNAKMTVVGVNVGGAYNLASGAAGLGSAPAGANSLPGVGMAAQASVLVGMNVGMLGMKSLGPIPTDRLKVYLSGMMLSLPINQITLGFTNFGLAGQYKIVPGAGAVLFGWGGMDVTAGLQYSRSTASYSSSINLNQTTDLGGGESVTMAYASDYTIGVASTNFTIPLEVSTNVSLLYMFGLYAGMGVNLNFGNAGTFGTASGPVTATYTGALPGVPSPLYTATANLNMDVEPRAAAPIFGAKFFAGAQANLWALKVVVHGTYFLDRNVAVAGGIRFAL